MPLPICVVSDPDFTNQGLFGNVFYYPFQILPYLRARDVFPAWEICSRHYGDPPELVTIPGALDLAYEPPSGPYRYLSLKELRRRHAYNLGNDWAKLSSLWHEYFRVPQRILTSAEELLPPGRVLGIHFRGNDKQTAAWDSNPITQDEYVVLLQEFVRYRDDFDAVFIATDEYAFTDTIRSALALPVTTLGEVGFHLDVNHPTPPGEKADRAMLDCVLLSRCAAVIETSSALPSFAKIFNPDLEIYRCAASKLLSGHPYFPVAHIPILPARSAETAQILEQTMRSDWTFDPAASKFQRHFSFAIRRPVHHTVFTVAETLGLGEMLNLRA